MLRRGLLRDYASAISLLTRMLDVILICVGGWLAYQLRFGETLSSTHLTTYAVFTIIAALSAAAIFPLLAVYDSWRAKGVLAPAGRALLAWFIVYTLALLILIMVHISGRYSRLWLGYWGILTSLLLIGLRLSIYWMLHTLRRRGYNHRPVVVVGANRLGRMLVERVKSADWSGLEVMGVFDLPEHLNNAIDESIATYSLDGLQSFINTHSISEIWIAMPLERVADLREVIEWLRNSPVNIRYAPDLFGLSLLNNGVTEIVGTPMIDLSTTPMQGINRLIKGLEDRLLASLIIILVSPLMLIIAIAIKLTSSGPVLFLQHRLGWDSRKILIYKFRTMYVHREHDILTQASKNDVRVTPLGRWLRRLSLDELPQFFNVLQGRMSIVGPRPHAIEHNEQYCNEIDRYMLRHKVKPGITGWAQVNGWRGETDTIEKMEQRIEHDLYYIDHWSLGFDIKIILLTLVRGFFHRNAY